MPAIGRFKRFAALNSVRLIFIYPEKNVVVFTTLPYAKKIPSPQLSLDINNLRLIVDKHYYNRINNMMYAYICEGSTRRADT